MRMIQDENFSDDPSHQITVRGIAFRALMRIDRQKASDFIGSRACREYLLGVDNWRRNASENLLRELDEESSWVRDQIPRDR